jgi:pyruvate/2-oxoglutarate dehydrogenase complex dihydrolipoamide acyltransferase (E2) component
MPYLMTSKAESVVLHDVVYDLTRARPWLRAYNRAHPDRATLFHLFAYACTRALHERPGLNRFVAGGRIHQRNEVSFAFAAKEEMSDAGGIVTVKIVVPPGDPFPEFVRRMTAAVARGRAGSRGIDREVALVARLPGPIVRLAVWLARALDAWNLLPALFTRDDPMFSSVFLANLGSAGLSNAFHHLYEYGTTAMFATLSAPARMPFVEGDAVVARDGVGARFTFDERINDGFYAARSLAIARRVVEDPERWLGDPAGPALPAAMGPSVETGGGAR